MDLHSIAGAIAYHQEAYHGNTTSHSQLRHASITVQCHVSLKLPGNEFLHLLSSQFLLETTLKLLQAI
jgi:hypothetical protein